MSEEIVGERSIDTLTWGQDLTRREQERFSIFSDRKLGSFLPLVWRLSGSDSFGGIVPQMRGC